MKRGTKLLALLGVLILVVGGAVIADRLNPENREETEASDSTVLIFHVNSEDVTTLTWTHEGETHTLSLEEGGWTCPEKPELEIDATGVQTMLSALQDVRSGKIIEEAEELAAYGLETPECRITVTVSGETKELCIGAESPVEGLRYLSNGDGSVYLETADSTLLSSFTHTPEDLCRETETTTESTSE